jgi:hypothetical protein
MFLAQSKLKTALDVDSGESDSWKKENQERNHCILESADRDESFVQHHVITEIISGPNWGEIEESLYDVGCISFISSR